MRFEAAVLRAGPGGAACSCGPALSGGRLLALASAAVLAAELFNTAIEQLADALQSRTCIRTSG